MRSLLRFHHCHWHASPFSAFFYSVSMLLTPSSPFSSQFDSWNDVITFGKIMNNSFSLKTRPSILWSGSFCLRNEVYVTAFDFTVICFKCWFSEAYNHNVTSYVEKLGNALWIFSWKLLYFNELQRMKCKGKCLYIPRGILVMIS